MTLEQALDASPCEVAVQEINKKIANVERYHDVTLKVHYEDGSLVQLFRISRTHAEHILNKSVPGYNPNGWSPSMEQLYED